MGIFDLFLMLLVLKQLFVQSLIADLGADAFARRERASYFLSRLGPLSLQDLRIAASTSSDLEVRKRAERLVNSMCLEAFRQASERHVTISSNNPNCTTRHPGTVICADGRQAYILTAFTAQLTCKEGGNVEWRGKKYKVRFSKFDAKKGFSLVLLPCKDKYSLLPLPQRHVPQHWWKNRIYWWNGIVADGKLNGRPVPLKKGEQPGGLVFVLDERLMRAELAGMDIGQIPGRGDGLHFADPVQIREFLDHTPGIDLRGK